MVDFVAIRRLRLLQKVLRDLDGSLSTFRISCRETKQIDRHFPGVGQEQGVGPPKTCLATIPPGAFPPVAVILPHWTCKNNVSDSLRPCAYARRRRPSPPAEISLHIRR